MGEIRATIQTRPVSMRSIQQSKRALRQKLANLSIAEKLRMLDTLRERTLAIRSASKSNAAIDPNASADLTLIAKSIRGRTQSGRL